MRLESIQNRLSELRSFLKEVSGSSWNLLEENCYVAGGFVRDAFLGAPFNDIDIFVKGDFDQVKEIVQSLRDSLADYHCESESFGEEGNATHFNPKMPVRKTDAFPESLLKAPIQLVNTSYGRITEVMEGFDYGVNKVAYDLKTGNVLFGVDCELQSLVSTDYGLRDYKHRPKIEDIANGLKIQGIKANLNWDLLDKMKFEENCTMEDASDVIRKVGRMISRCSRLGNDLGGYGVSFDGTIDQLTGRLLELTANLMSANMGYDEESYDIKNLMNVEYITGGLDIGKGKAHHELTDNQRHAIVRNTLINRVSSMIKNGESSNY
jgi:hypothetical protein